MLKIGHFPVGLKEGFIFDLPKACETQLNYFNKIKELYSLVPRWQFNCIAESRETDSNEQTSFLEFKTEFAPASFISKTNCFLYYFLRHFVPDYLRRNDEGFPAEIKSHFSNGPKFTFLKLISSVNGKTVLACDRLICLGTRFVQLNELTEVEIKLTFHEILLDMQIISLYSARDKILLSDGISEMK